ncbi:MAG: hypothetical protein ACTSPE_08915 [Candidatus Thorarchaeota archaeon]
MPRRKKKSSKAKAILVLIIVVVVGTVIVVWHDGEIGATSIADINAGNVKIGTAVTVKGELTARLGNLHTVTTIGGSNTVAFIWDGTSPPVGSVIIVRGQVSSPITLSNVTSVQVTWLFK